MGNILAFPAVLPVRIAALLWGLRLLGECNYLSR